MGYCLSQTVGFQSPIAHVQCGKHAYVDKDLSLDASALSYYLHHLALDKPLFRSFLFSPIRTSKGIFLDPLYIGFTEPGAFPEWSEWMLELFRPGVNLSALGELLKQSAGSGPIDIWVTLPYPDPRASTFQITPGRVLDFTRMKDRLDALLWWIDLFRTNWAYCGIHPLLRFKGFRWPMDSLQDHDVELVTRLAVEIHHRSSHFIWAANYGTNHIINWKTIGFDAALVNPNYYGNNDLSKDWIQYAKLFAHYYELGLQFNYGKGLIYDDRHMYEYLEAARSAPSIVDNKAFLLFHFENTNLFEIAKQQPALYQDISHFTQQLSNA